MPGFRRTKFLLVDRDVGITIQFHLLIVHAVKAIQYHQTNALF